MRRVFSLAVATLFCLALATVAIPPIAGASGTEPNKVTLKKGGAAFSNLAGNVSHTFDAVDVSGWNTAIFAFKFTLGAGGTCTKVVGSFEESYDNVTWYLVPELVKAGSTLTHGQRSYEWPVPAVPASFNGFFEVPLLFKYLRGTVSCTGGAAADRLAAELHTGNW